MTYFAKLKGMSDQEAKQAVDQIAQDLEMVEYIDIPFLIVQLCRWQQFFLY